MLLSTEKILQEISGLISKEGCEPGLCSAGEHVMPQGVESMKELRTLIFPSLSQ